MNCGFFARYFRRRWYTTSTTITANTSVAVAESAMNTPSAVAFPPNAPAVGPIPLIRTVGSSMLSGAGREEEEEEEEEDWELME